MEEGIFLQQNHTFDFPFDHPVSGETEQNSSKAEFAIQNS